MQFDKFPKRQMPHQANHWHRIPELGTNDSVNAAGALDYMRRSFLPIEVALHGEATGSKQRGRESFSASDRPHGKRVTRKRLPTPSARFHQKISGRMLTRHRTGSR